MDFLEKIYEGEINLKNSVELNRPKFEMEENLYYEYKEKFINSLKTDEQKEMFKNLDLLIESRVKNYSKEMFLTGFNCGLKMGVEANNCVNDFDYKKSDE